MEVEDRTLDAQAATPRWSRSRRWLPEVHNSDEQLARRTPAGWQTLREQMKEYGVRYRDMIDYTLGFVPWVGFLVVSVILANSSAALLFACLVGLGLSVVMALPMVRLGPLTTLDVGSFIFFPAMAVLQFVFGIADFGRWSTVLATVALAAAVGVGLATGKPFTAIYSRSGVPQVQWQDSSFIDFQLRITKLWFSGLALIALATLISTMFPVDSVPSIFFGWAVPIGIVSFVMYQQAIRITKRKAVRAQRVQAHFNSPLITQDPIVEFVGHVTATAGPSQIRALHKGLASLGLVEAWKFSQDEHDGNGGIRLGNLNIALASRSETGHGNGIAFEPRTLNGLGGELSRRGLAHSEPTPPPDGESRDYLATELPNLSSLGSLKVELSAALSPVRTESAVAPDNEAGIIDVSKVLIGVTSRRAKAWGELLSPTTLNRDPLHFSQGPDIQFVASRNDQVEAVVIAVSDIDVAWDALITAGLREDGDSLWCGSIRFDLVE